MAQPERLGKYDIVEVLGKGAMGVVFKGFDPDIDRTVAIKTVRKELIEEEDRAGMALARFKNEARAAGRLSHPGIVAVYDYGESGSIAYIAMEFVQGNSLREYFNRGTRFAERDAISIMVQLLDALQHAHYQGVWHRDIKPANMIIMTNGKVKIADFGIARIDTSTLTQTGVVMGSPGLHGARAVLRREVDRRADLFAAGVVMYQLLTGARPFAGSVESIPYKICHVDPPLPSEAEPDRGWERYNAVITPRAREASRRTASRPPTSSGRRSSRPMLNRSAPTVSEETIIAEPTTGVGMLFEPSNPSARTHPDVSIVLHDSRADALLRRLGPDRHAHQPAYRPARAPARGRTPSSRGRRAAVAPHALVGRRRRRGGRPARRRPRDDAASCGRTRTGEAGTVTLGSRAPTPAPTPTRVAPPPRTADSARARGRSRPAAVREPRRKPVRPPAAQAGAPARAQGRAAPPGGEARAAEAGAPAPSSAKRSRQCRRPKPQPEARGGFWRDQVLTTKVQAKLQFNRRLWDASGGIQVAARSGVVTLTGIVPSREDIAEAERIAAAVDGVTSVRNELRIGVPHLPVRRHD